MSLVKAVLFLVVALAALVTSAAAQGVVERNAADIEERTTTPEPSSGRATVETSIAPRLMMASLPMWVRDYAVTSNVPRPAALFPPQTLPVGARFVTPRGPAMRMLRVINGRFLPIPMLQWRTRVGFDPRAMLAISPSILIGRRPTFMPEGFRGGRTFGVAVHVRIHLDQPAVMPQAAPAGSRTALMVSRVRALLPAR